MSLDIVYRPQTFGDVLGQQDIIKILGRYILSGEGFHQSYIFAGPHGSGKTSLARILARALLCPRVGEDGSPCNQCVSCSAILEGGSVDLVEVDAATRSGKEDVTRIIESLDYQTLSGRRTIYIFDESHRLSSQALDALLKPMEDVEVGSRNKRLVCIFCTTEPQKMRNTIASRCGITFFVKRVDADTIAGRLAHICEQEKIENDPDILPLLARATKCHVRDAIKALEGIARLGVVSKDRVYQFLHLNLNDSYLDLLLLLPSNPTESIRLATVILRESSPLTCYERLAEAAIVAYETSLGVRAPALYWDIERLTRVSEALGNRLIDLARLFSESPSRATGSMLVCDLLEAHRSLAGIAPSPVTLEPLEGLSGSPQGSTLVHVVSTPVLSIEPSQEVFEPLEPSPKPAFTVVKASEEAPPEGYVPGALTLRGSDGVMLPSPNSITDSDFEPTGRPLSYSNELVEDTEDVFRGERRQAVRPGFDIVPSQVSLKPMHQEKYAKGEDPNRKVSEKSGIVAEGATSEGASKEASAEEASNMLNDLIGEL